MKCLVCESDPARYRCRHCKAAYCSSNCFKTHREWNTAHDEAVTAGTRIEDLPTPSPFSCEHVQRDRKASSDTKKTPTSGTTPSSASRGDVDGKDGSEELPQRHSPEDLFSDATHDALKQRRREAQTHVLSTSALDATADDGEKSGGGANVDVEEDGQLCILREHHLSALANSSSLRNALKTRELQAMIRTIDRSRSRLEALETALYNHPEFAQFCDTVKATIASAEHRHA